MVKIIKFLLQKRSYKLKLFVVLYFVLLGMLSIIRHIFHETTFTSADAGLYTQLSQSFIQDGAFSIHNFPQTYRGYLFPLIIMLPIKLGHNFLFYQLVNIAVYAVMAVFLLPKLFDVKLSGKSGYVSTILFSVLLFMFWHWLLIEVLSDGWAFFFALLSIVLLKTAYNTIQYNTIQYDMIRYDTIRSVLNWIRGLCVCGIQHSYDLPVFIYRRIYHNHFNFVEISHDECYPYGSSPYVPEKPVTAHSPSVTGFFHFRGL